MSQVKIKRKSEIPFQPDFQKCRAQVTPIQAKAPFSFILFYSSRTGYRNQV